MTKPVIDKFKDDIQPVTFQERMMYEQTMYLNAMCNMLDSIVKYIAKSENIATEKHVDKIEKPKTRKKRTTSNPKE